MLTKHDSGIYILVRNSIAKLSLIELIGLNCKTCFEVIVCVYQLKNERESIKALRVTCVVFVFLLRCGPRWDVGAARHPPGDEGGRDVRRGAVQHPAHGRPLGAERVRLHRPPGELPARGQDGGRFQPAHDFLRELSHSRNFSQLSFFTTSCAFCQ